MNTKQVIVFRKDLLKGDHALRKGKIAAQVAHGSLGALLNFFHKTYTKDKNNKKFRYEVEFKEGSILDSWLNGSFTKIVVGVDTEADLLNLQEKCNEAHIPCSLITDAGNTEFHGVPTVTCLGIGPYISEELDKITGNLPLI